MNLEKFEEKMVRNTVERRFKKKQNRIKIQFNKSDSAVILQQVNEEKISKLLKAKEDSGVNFSGTIINDFGYTDGLVYADKLISENNYNLVSLLEAINLIPNSCAFLTFGTSYALGFFAGLFGKNKGTEHNFFIKKWRKILVTEFH